MRRITAIGLCVAAVGIASATVAKYYAPLGSYLGFAGAKVRGGYSVDQRLVQYGGLVAGRMTPSFAAAGVAYPPHEIAYVAFKDKRVLEVYARNAGDESWRYVKEYPVLAASGLPGPKLKEGDRQVPEGVYRAELLNPNSRFHLSIRLNYPNAFDRKMAAVDGRTTLGGDIMIHGSRFSIGCLAMGDEAAEDLFVLSALAGIERTRIVVSPTDFRGKGAVAPAPFQVAWSGELYDQLRGELKQFPVNATRPKS